jgi:hypothetical protein
MLSFVDCRIELRGGRRSFRQSCALYICSRLRAERIAENVLELLAQLGRERRYPLRIGKLKVTADAEPQQPADGVTQRTIFRLSNLPQIPLERRRRIEADELRDAITLTHHLIVSLEPNPQL